MDNSFRSIIDQSNSFFIILPSKPFFDQVAAGLSLYLSIRDLKSTQIATDSEMTVEFNRLIGVNKIVNELGNKNLVIKFTDYPASDIERVSYDIEDSQFRLSVIPKEKINPPTKEQINISYSGVAADTIFMIGGANESHFPFMDNPEISNAKLIHIGTKNLTTSKKVISFSTSASSTSEIMARILLDNSLKVDQDIASNLVMGIEEGSQKFSGDSVTPITFEVFAELLRAGGSRENLSIDPQNYPVGSIPSQPVQQAMPSIVGSKDQSKYVDQSQYSPQINPSDQTVRKIPQNKEPVNDQKANNEDIQLSNGDDQAPKDWLEPKIYKGTSVK